VEILDRYLKSLRSALPEAQRDDIINELSEDIHRKIDDEEAELGRSMSKGELESMLKRYGHPLVVASRYRQDQGTVAFGRQLIGPALFPLYTKVLTFNLGITGVIILIVFSALLASGQSRMLRESLLTTFLLPLLIQFLVVTAIFTFVDRNLAKYPDRWDVGTWVAGSPPALFAPAKRTSIPRTESVAQVVALAVFVAWLRAARIPLLIFGPAAPFLKTTPELSHFYAPVVVLALLGMVQAAINFVHPDWVRLALFFRTAERAAALAICCLLIRAGVWVVSTVASGDAARTYHRAAAVINTCVFWSLVGLAIALVLFLIRDLNRIVRDTGHPSARKAAANL
jgi:hypothetical protein